MTNLLSARWAMASVGVICGVAVLSGMPQGHATSAPAFPTAEPVTNRIVVEEEYAFSLRRYQPGVEFRPVARVDATYDTPEATTIALLSAMAARDVDWFRSLWDAESVRLMDARDKEKGQTAAFWTAAWDKTLKDRRITITSRIETGAYVFIVYELSPQGALASSGEAIELETPLKQIAGRWVATQELSSDPVLLYWKTPNVRTHRVVRGVHP